jgi:CubicO group peptidase (beta-lactamase class C family)
MGAKRTTSIVVALCVAGACGGGGKGARAPGPVEPPPGAGSATTPGGSPAADGAAATMPARFRTLAQDETITTASSATFTASAGWSLSDAGGVVRANGPEGDVSVTYVELEADAGKAAIAAAWARARPDFALAVQRADDFPGRDGWDAATQIAYVTPAAEDRAVIAAALGKGRTWRVFLIDATAAGLSRRGAQVGTMIESLKAAGVARESWAGRPAATLDATRLATIDAFVEQAMKAEDIPGAALAIVQGGKVVHERGFGVRELGGKAKVGPHTLFLTGSTGKSLVTLMMARAVDQGVFGWDTPVTELLPGFALADAEVTKALRVRHTVCACTGMPRQDLEMIFESRGVTAEQRLADMKAMAPTTKFGETFQYSNLLVATGGYLAAHALLPELPLGAAFDQAMQAQVFGPLGMKDTTYDFARARKADHATPHARDLAGTMTAVPVDDETWVSAVRPAGGQWSSVHDYARVLLLELGNGVLDGKRVISEANLLERRKPQVAITPERSYGMGLVVGTRSGVEVVAHDGGTAGFTTTYYWLPQHGVGVVAVANVGGASDFVEGVGRRVLEVLFDGEAQAEPDLALGVERRKQATAEELARVSATVDAAWSAPFVGGWSAPGLGRIELRRAGPGLLLDAGEWKVTVGEKRAADGTRLLAITGAPFAGFEILPEQRDGRWVLVVRDGQQTYAFEKLAR